MAKKKKPIDLNASAEDPTRGYDRKARQAYARADAWARSAPGTKYGAKAGPGAARQDDRKKTA